MRSSSKQRGLIMCFSQLFNSFKHNPNPNPPRFYSSNNNKGVSADDFAFLRDTSTNTNTFDSSKYSRDSILISNTLLLNQDQFGDNTLKFLRQFRGKLSDSLVIDVLNLITNPHICINFFVWAGRQIGYTHSEPAYNVLLETIGFNKEGNKVPDHFLRDIGDNDREILGKLLHFLIRKCCRNGLWNVALEEFERLKQFGYKPSNSTYIALILVFLKAGRLDTASLLHKEMSSLGFNMDGFTVGCFAQALCKAGRWKEALSIIENEDFVPNTETYNKMISGLCEASLFEEAINLLHKMRSNSCLPNVVTYTTLLLGSLRKRQLARCKRILGMMINEGCYPSPSIFNSLLHAYCIAGEYAYGYKLLNKMESYGCRPGYVPYNIFIGGVCGNNELPSSNVMELAEKVYGEMLDAGMVLNKMNVGNFVRCLCSVGKFEKAFSVIREMMCKGFIPDTNTYSNVIEFLCQASKVEKAFHLFQEMKGNGIIPDVYTYTILIDSFCKAGLLQQATNLFDEMVQCGCAPNVVTYTALIHAYLKMRKVSQANQLFEKMLSAGCVPNIVTYTALVDGHCKAGDFEKACQIYSRMSGNGDIKDVDMYFKGDETNPTEPNVFTYGALVDGLCKAHKVVEARDLLDTMSAANCEPNHIVYDALIDGFCKAGKLDEAQQVVTKMSERGYSPNVYTYSSLIDRLFKDKRLDLVLKVLSKMLESSCPPNVVTYTEMIDGLCKVGKTDEAYKLLVMMEEKGYPPNVVTYTVMIDGFGKAGNVDMCLELFGQMSAKGCAPNFVTYRVLINHCCAVGLFDEARKLLEEMKQTYWPRQVEGYRKVIEGFNKEYLMTLGLLDEVSENASSPIVPTYEILIDSLCKAGRLEVALELHKEIITYSGVSAASKNMYSSLIESLALAGKMEKAFGLYADMARQGCIPEIWVFFLLINTLIRTNKWDEALQLSYSICHMDICWHPREEIIDGI
ncbi:hypothetical protein GIB67_041058 [Kingdonia uniflora]|uniref:Pentatricopeptide repeat-containing protein n=1 Tax=Kingdonia uniflora TaxID=39325 RepID=A0A7J7LKD0_9MAGN|nr:hypothetical protein GIB67_041058 [Kingdonia uniflora]